MSKLTIRHRINTSDVDVCYSLRLGFYVGLRVIW